MRSEILEDVKEIAAGYGVNIGRGDVRDLSFPGNVQEVMNRVLAAERRSQAQLVEARTKAEVQRIEAESKAEAARLQATSTAEAIRHEVIARATATETAVAGRAIEGALVELGAYGKSAGVNTEVLARQLRPQDLGESTEDYEEVLKYVKRGLGERSKIGGILETYAHPKPPRSRCVTYGPGRRPITQH